MSMRAFNKNSKIYLDSIIQFKNSDFIKVSCYFIISHKGVNH